MADPYGILAVCTTSFKVAQALHGFIERLREVPNELLALSNEVCDLKFVLDSVQKAIHQNERLGASQLSNVGPMLFQARVKLDSLDNLVSNWAKINRWGDSVRIGKIDRLYWLKEKKKVCELQKQLREIRQGLCVLLGAGNMIEGVDGIKQLFANKEASPDDVHHRGGWTPLHLRITPRAAGAFARIFSQEDYIQTRHFNRLHKLVAELEIGNLGAELTSGTVSDIDGRDVDGWTALHWAARRGDSDAVALLLAHGADPRLTTWNEGRSALHLAAPSNSALCVQQILQWRRGNAMVDLELRDTYGCTPLHVATESNTVTTAAALIASSADLNARENFGFTPLVYAIMNNQVDATRELLCHGADYKIPTTFGDNILHFAANIATIPMLAVLTEARIRGLVLEARNSEGLTVGEIVARREEEVPEAFSRAFDRLIRSIVDEDLEAGSWTSDSLAESWHSIEDAE
ncbi:MAG: hypothetical protein Q9208_004412 [Pyrenodesmia sp. 3 TL-2023]